MSTITKCNAAELKVGDNLSTTVYYTVVEKLPGKTVVTDETGARVTISNGVLERESYSATQYTDEKKVSRTDAVKVLQNAGDTQFECEFTKKDGTKRRMVARRRPGVPGDTVFGRTECIESVPGSTTGETQKRQIDHRTLASITWKRRKYTVK